MFFQLAWRNIWRNPRRTAVIIVAVVIGIWAMIFLGAFMRGMIEDMIDNGIATLTGDIQIHAKGYLNDPSIAHRITGKEQQKIEAALHSVLPPGTRWTCRVRVNGVAANARHSGGITIVGIDPHTEAAVSFIGHAVHTGHILAPADPDGIIVGHALLKKYETRIGHKLVLMSQNTKNTITSRAFRIIGTYRAEMESTEKEFVFINLPSAKKMLKMDNSISEISILLSNHDDADAVAAALQKRLPSLSVLSWRELLPMLRAYLQIFEGFQWIWYVVFFIAMGIGLVNTTLMTVFERMREFGLLKSLGMPPGWIVRLVLAESFFLLAVGAVIGNLLGVVSVAVFSGHGIDLSALSAGAAYAGITRIIYPALAVSDMVAANLVVFGLGLLVSLYPAVKAGRIKPVTAMAYV